jgi:ribosomal protein S27E
MRDRLATIREARPGLSAVAACWGCGTVLATRGAAVRLADGLVSRPEKREGLPRYGLPRRLGHGDAREAGDRLANAATRSVGNPAALYVNCPRCDRGQVIRWPLRSRA